MHVLRTVLFMVVSLVSQETSVSTSIALDKASQVNENLTVTVTSGSARSREAFDATEVNTVVVDLRLEAKEVIGLRLQLSSDTNEAKITLGTGGATVAPKTMAIYDPDKSDRAQVFRTPATDRQIVALILGGPNFGGKRVVSLFFELPETASGSKTLRFGFKADEMQHTLLVKLP